MAGCNYSPLSRLDTLAKDTDFSPSLIFHTDSFKILGKGKNRSTSSINVYIEGDGMAWLDLWTIADDPTPSDPMGFRLALVDPRPSSVLYLARPCQYVADCCCKPLDWTANRFSQQIINAYHQVLDQVKNKWGAQNFRLHAYSGGATIALLLAAQRQDISQIITFAPLLDHAQWTKYHHYSPLRGSLNPVDYPNRLKSISQQHYIGLDDLEIPLSVSSRYFKEIPESARVCVIKVPFFHHYSDWPGLWESLLLNQKGNVPTYEVNIGMTE